MFKRINKTAFSAAKSTFRAFSEEASHSRETASQALMKRIEVPVWGMVSAGIAAAGFFGKMLHDDNLATRTELHQLGRDLREDHKELRVEHKELRVEHKELREEMHAMDKRMMDGFYMTDKKMTEGFQKLNDAIVDSKKSAEPSKRGWF